MLEQAFKLTISDDKKKIKFNCKSHSMKEETFVIVM